MCVCFFFYSTSFYNSTSQKSNKYKISCKARTLRDKGEKQSSQLRGSPELASTSSHALHAGGTPALLLGIHRTFLPGSLPQVYPF